jgi:TctA family transporter
MFGTLIAQVILVVMSGLVPGIHDFSVFESEHYQKD